MFHHFPGEAGVERACLVRSTDFNYSDEVDPTDVRNPVYTFLRAVIHSGYRRNNGGYDKRSLPPVEFNYTEPIVRDAVEEVDPASLENLPIGLAWKACPSTARGAPMCWSRKATPSSGTQRWQKRDSGPRVALRRRSTKRKARASSSLMARSPSTWLICRATA